MYSSTLKAPIKKVYFYLSFINLVKPTFSSKKLIFVNKQISYFFPLRCFLELTKFMPINFKLINFMLMNFKLIDFMSMNFVNKQISYFFPPRCFLMLFSAYKILS